jgi:hypothetical protein
MKAEMIMAKVSNNLAGVACVIIYVPLFYPAIVKTITDKKKE